MRGRLGSMLCVFALIGCYAADAPRHADAGRDAATVDANTSDANTADAHSPDAQAPALTDAQVAEGAIDPDAIYLGTCPHERVDPTLPIGRTAPGACMRSGDCTREPNGRCMGYVENGVLMFPRCVYDTCAIDGDCTGDQRCRCGFSGLRQCLRVDCEDDADCADGQQCERTQDWCTEVQLGDFICTTPNDECVTHQDCIDRGDTNVCQLNGQQRVCSIIICD